MLQKYKNNECFQYKEFKDCNIKFEKFYTERYFVILCLVVKQYYYFHQYLTVIENLSLITISAIFIKCLSIGGTENR